MESSLWGTKLYLNMKHLDDMDVIKEVDANLTAG